MVPEVTVGRRKIIADPKERQRLIAALAKHDGNITETAKAMGVHRVTLARSLKRNDALLDATQLRALGGITGPRSRLAEGSIDPDGEREEIARAIVTAGGYPGAAASLGLCPRGLKKKMKRLGMDEKPGSQ